MPIGWGIISTGRHPDLKMAPAINASKGSHIAAVMSRDIGRAQAFAAKHNASTAVDDVDVLIENPNVDAVYIASPNFLHAEQTIKAAKAGKHVLVEKPMALSIADAEQMIEACLKFSVTLGGGFHLRAHGAHQAIRELVVNGDLGNIHFAEANWGRGVRGQESVPPRSGLQAWWDEPKMIGAGAFMATGVHCVDLLRYALSDEIIAVNATTDATHAKPLEEFAHLVLEFSRGTIATLMTGRKTPDYYRNEIGIYGTLGSAYTNSTIDMNQEGSLSIHTDKQNANMQYEYDPINLYKVQVEAFESSLISKQHPLATGIDGLRTVEATVAMLESAKIKAQVKLK